MNYKKYGILDRKIDDLEMDILSCLLNNPKLMNDERLTDDLFKAHSKIWIFMKTVYKRYGCFDLSLMFNNVRNKYNYVGMIMELLNVECVTSNFDWYVKDLINLRKQNENESLKINAIFTMAHDLMERNITLKEFKDKIDEMFKED